MNLHSNMDDYRPGAASADAARAEDLHSNMDDYRLEMSDLRNWGLCYLHSNMDDYRPRSAQEDDPDYADLHSNMDDYRPRVEIVQLGGKTIFTFQYGRL